MDFNDFLRRHSSCSQEIPVNTPKIPIGKPALKSILKKGNSPGPKDPPKSVRFSCLMEEKDNFRTKLVLLPIDKPEPFPVPTQNKVGLQKGVRKHIGEVECKANDPVMKKGDDGNKGQENPNELKNCCEEVYPSPTISFLLKEFMQILQEDVDTTGSNDNLAFQCQRVAYEGAKTTLKRHRVAYEAVTTVNGALRDDWITQEELKALWRPVTVEMNERHSQLRMKVCLPGLNLPALIEEKIWEEVEEDELLDYMQSACGMASNEAEDGDEQFQIIDNVDEDYKNIDLEESASIKKPAGDAQEHQRDPIYTGFVKSYFSK